MSFPTDAAAAAATSYWCYRCSRFVRVPTGGAVICPGCETGFVELVETPPRVFPSSPGAESGRRRSPATAMYMFHAPTVDGTARRRRDRPEAGFRRGSTGNRYPFNPVIVLRGPTDGGSGPGADAERGGNGTFELYYDDGMGSGLRPLPASMSDFLMDSGFDRLLDQLSQIEINGVVGRGQEQPPASKEAVESMPTIEIAERHVRSDSHCAVCTDPFLLGTEAREMPCKHIYHQDCILPWLSQRNSCPVCRHEMPTDDDGEQTLAGGAEEDAVGLTIWRLPGGGFAVGRFSGGRRAGDGEQLPVVYTEVDGGFNDAGGAPRRISWTTSTGGGRSRDRGGLGRAFRPLFSLFGRLWRSSSRLPRTRSDSGSSSRRTARRRGNNRASEVEDAGGLSRL